MATRTERLRVEGMQCSGCESTIEEAVSNLAGVMKVKASYQSATVEVSYEDHALRLSQILKAIEDRNYLATTVGLVGASAHGSSTWWATPLKYFVVFVVVGGVVYWGYSIMPGVMAKMHSQHVSHALMLAVGLLTGFHCIGMCGSFVVSYTISGEPRSLPSLVSAHALYALGKTFSYALIGAGFGALGGIVTITPLMRGIVAIASGVFVMLWGIKMLRLFSGMTWLSWNFPKFLMHGVQSGMRRKPRPLVIGLLSGFLLGCGALQAMYVVAAGTGSAREGALLLTFFGLGTLGPLLSFGFVAHLLSRRVLNELLRVSGALVLIMGLMMTDRGLRVAGSGYDFHSLYDRWQVLWEEIRSGAESADSGHRMH